MSHLSNAAEAMAAVARAITDDQLANKTPCTEYDVRALVNHLLFWGPSLAGAGRKEAHHPLGERGRQPGPPGRPRLGGRRRGVPQDVSEPTLDALTVAVAVSVPGLVP